MSLDQTTAGGRIGYGSYFIEDHSEKGNQSIESSKGILLTGTIITLQIEACPIFNERLSNHAFTEDDSPF